MNREEEVVKRLGLSNDQSWQNLSLAVGYLRRDTT